MTAGEEYRARVRAAAAQAMREFPGDSDDEKERRALMAALYVQDGLPYFENITALRLWLEKQFTVSERNIRRCEKILPYPGIVKLVLKGPVSVTNAAHVIEHAGIDMLRIAWMCAPKKDRELFVEFVKREGL